jgi:hypothetical protein
MIPSHIPMTCPWCKTLRAHIENPDHSRAGRFLLGACADCNWMQEYDRGESYDTDSEDLNPPSNEHADRH